MVSRVHKGKQFNGIVLIESVTSYHFNDFQFNPDKNGEVRLKEMRRLLVVLGEMHRIMPEDAIDDILSLADKDSNGKLSYVEFVDLVKYNLDCTRFHA